MTMCGISARRCDHGARAVCGRRSSLVAAVLFSVSLLTGIWPGEAYADVTTVSGSAFGYYSSATFDFGAGPSPADINGPESAVTLPATGGSETASVPSAKVFSGPAVFFSSGPITVSTAGTAGPSGSSTSSVSIVASPEGGWDPFYYGTVNSTCASSETASTASTTLSDSYIYLGGGEVVQLPDNPEPGSEYFGTIDGVGDNFRIVVNEQVVTSDSITVNAMHMYMLGPIARGELIVGQSHCDVVSTSANRAPVARDDTFEVAGNTRLAVPAPGVLANDSDPNGHSLSTQVHTDAIVSSYPTNGTLALNPDGSFIYTPDIDFSGSDAFTYLARDPRGGADTATVMITVGPPSTGTLQNDNFADAQVISGPSGYLVSPSTAGATTEPGEPFIGAGPSIWYQRTAPADGEVTFDSCGTTYNAVQRIYTGTAVDALTEVYTLTGGGCPEGVAGASSTFNVTAGTVYYITVVGDRDYDVGNTVLSWTLTPSPANDDFVDAQVISGTSGSVAATNSAATYEGGVDWFDYSIWYQWTAPADGVYAFDTCGSDFDTIVAVYTGEIDTLTGVPAQNVYGTYPVPECAGPRGRQLMRAGAGTVYHIAVGGGTTGNVVLSWSQLSQAPNDDFADAEVLLGPSGTVTGSNGPDSMATIEPGEYVHANHEAALSIWYRWTAPADGEVTFQTCDSGFDTLLAVYTGGAVGALTEVASDNDGCGSSGGSRVTFNARASTTYHIVVDGVYQVYGTVVLDWNQVISNQVPRAVNDAYNATAGTPLRVNAPGVLGNDTDPDGNVLTAGSASDPAGGSVTLTSDGSFTYTPDTVFVGIDTFTYRASDGSGGTATATVTISVTRPLVGPPTDADACKNGGWKNFNSPVFKNQGACVSYVNASPGRRL